MSILAWFKGLKRRRLDDEDFTEEIRAHLAIAADERVANGADRREAQLASLKDFGNVTHTREAARRVWIPSWLETLRDYASDVRYSLRVLEVNNYQLTIVGVADPTFHGTIGGYEVELFIPLMMAPQLGINVGSLQNSASAGVLADPGPGILDVLGYLRPGVTLANAGAQIDALSAALARESALAGVARQLKVLRIWQSPYGGQAQVLPILIVLGVMGVLVLLIACANIAGSSSSAASRAAEKSPCVSRSARRAHAWCGC